MVSINYIVSSSVNYYSKRVLRYLDTKRRRLDCIEKNKKGSESDFRKRKIRMLG